MGLWRCQRLFELATFAKTRQRGSGSGGGGGAKEFSLTSLTSLSSPVRPPARPPASSLACLLAHPSGGHLTAREERSKKSIGKCAPASEPPHRSRCKISCGSQAVSGRRDNCWPAPRALTGPRAGALASGARVRPAIRRASLERRFCWPASASAAPASDCTRSRQCARRLR